MELFHNKTRRTRPDGTTTTANVVLVDWSLRSVNVYINKAATNSRVVSVELTQFLQKLHFWAGYDVAKITMLGHSFGAQIIGSAGARLFDTNNIRAHKIIALDPADQCYNRNKVTPYEGFLTQNRDVMSPLSAQSVIALHTDGSVGGTYRRFETVNKCPPL